MEYSQRLSIPLLSAGQAQKEVFHNEALQLLDIAVAAAVEGPAQSDPPQAPAAGTCYLVGDAPTGDWLDKPGCLAGYTQAGWRFVAPVTGMTVLVKSSETVGRYAGGRWDIGTVRASSLVIEGSQVVGPQAQAIADAAGGTTIDAEARLTISAILAALRQHGLISA